MAKTCFWLLQGFISSSMKAPLTCQQYIVMQKPSKSFGGHLAQSLHENQAKQPLCLTPQIYPSRAHHSTSLSKEQTNKNPKKDNPRRRGSKSMPINCSLQSKPQNTLWGTLPQDHREGPQGRTTDLRRGSWGLWHQEWVSIQNHP